MNLLIIIAMQLSKSNFYGEICAHKWTGFFNNY